MSSDEATSTPTPKAPSSAGFACSHRRAQLGVEVGCLCCQRLVAASQGSQRFFGCRCHGFAVGVWSQPGANLDQLRGCEPSELVLEALGGGHSHRVDLVGGDGAGLDR